MATTAEIRDKFTPQAVNLGLVDNGADLIYAIQNNSDLDIEYHSKSCGCLGTVKSSPRMIEGGFTAVYSEPAIELRDVDGELCRAINQGDTIRFMRCKDNMIAPNPQVIGNPIYAKEFSQSVVAYMKDGNLSHRVTENGEQEVNPDKLKITIPIKVFVKRPT